MVEVRATLTEAGYTIGEFDTYDEANEFARWLQREHVSLRAQYDAARSDKCPPALRAYDIVLPRGGRAG